MSIPSYYRQIPYWNKPEIFELFYNQRIRAPTVEELRSIVGYRQGGLW